MLEMPAYPASVVGSATLLAFFSGLPDFPVISTSGRDLRDKPSENFPLLIACRLGTKVSKLAVQSFAKTDVQAFANAQGRGTQGAGASQGGGEDGLLGIHLRVEALHLLALGHQDLGGSAQQLPSRLFAERRLARIDGFFHGNL